MKEVVIRGVVEHGRRLGRQLGFPTANIAVPNDRELSDGVYRSEVTIDGVTYCGMSNLGCNPSVGGDERRLETHLFDFAGDLYGREIEVCLVEKIRDEHRFESLEALQNQLEADKKQLLHNRNKK